MIKTKIELDKISRETIENDIASLTVTENNPKKLSSLFNTKIKSILREKFYENYEYLFTFDISEKWAKAKIEAKDYGASGAALAQFLDSKGFSRYYTDRFTGGDLLPIKYDTPWMTTGVLQERLEESIDPKNYRISDSKNSSILEADMYVDDLDDEYPIHINEMMMSGSENEQGLMMLNNSQENELLESLITQTDDLFGELFKDKK